MNKAFLFFFFLASYLYCAELHGQIYAEKNSLQLADSNIKKLKEGALIIPFITQSEKIKILENLIISPELNKKRKKSVQKQLEKEIIAKEEFNMAIAKHFVSFYDFSKVYFVYDRDLHQFDPESAVFIDPKSMLPDSLITFKEKNYFFLKYYRASGIATIPSEIRFFYLADEQNNILERPFPNSPGRKSSFKIRFRDLLNISPDTNQLIRTLATKLNSNLHRYSTR